MAYSVKFDLGGVEFSIGANTIEDLKEEYVQLGGDPKWFIEKAEEVVKLIEKGDYVSTVKRALGGTVISDAATKDGDQTGVGPDAWGQDDPWRRPAAPQTRERTDPWDDSPVEEARPAQRRTGPFRGSSGGRAPHDEEASQGGGPHHSDGAYTLPADKFGRQWTLGLPDAPTCDCGEPAARMKGKSGPNSKRPGSPYTVFKCAKGAPDGDWRTKCEFSEFPN